MSELRYYAITIVDEQGDIMDTHEFMAVDVHQALEHCTIVAERGEVKDYEPVPEYDDPEIDSDA